MREEEKSEYRNKGVINGKLFCFDAEHKLCYQVDNPGNYCLYSRMAWNVVLQELEFTYNTDLNVFDDRKITGPGSIGEGLIKVRVPLDIAMVKFRNNLTHDALNHHSKLNFCNIAYLGKSYEHRVEGITQPMTVISHRLYEIDLSRNHLYHRDSGSTLSLSAFQKISEQSSTQLIGYLDVRTHKLIDYRQLGYQTGDNIKRIILPEQKLLDPVGVALMERKAPYCYLHLNPDLAITPTELALDGATKAKNEAIEDERKKEQRHRLNR